MRSCLEYLIKHNAFVQLCYRKIVSAFFKILGCFIKTDPKLVLLTSMSGDQYNDSPRVLFKAMLKDDYFKTYHYIWAFKNPEKFNVPHAETIKIDTMRYFIVALKAKIWITNVNIERGLDFKKKNTIYLNTWHGTGPKKGGNAVPGRKDYDFSRVDIFCCDGQYTHDVFMKWWNTKEESMLWCGRPREDELFQLNEVDKNQIKKQLGLPLDKKIVLYMPTWRENDINLFSWEKWKEKLGTKYIILERIHHFNKDSISQLNHDYIVDVTSYDDVNKLYLIADVLVSDYSSAFFDYGLLGKPMLCYAPDYDLYCKNPGLFMDLKEEFPGGIKKREEDIVNDLLTMDYSKASIATQEYVNHYVSHPVNATESCINRLKELIK